MPGQDYTISQFDTTQYHQAYNVLAAICGPNVAEAFMKYYGSTKFTPDQIVNLAKDAGLWSANNGMFGPASEKALLDRLGIPVDFSPQININDLQQKVMNGYMGAVSTPAHYFALQGYDPSTGLWDTGNTGTAYRAGNRYLTWDQITKIGGAPNGQFIASQLPGTGVNNVSGADRFQINPNDPNSVSDYIRIAAQARGIDPEIAVRVAQTEGLNTYVGDNGSSFGPFQLHYGNVAGGGNAVSGLGDAFTKATGLDARNNATIAAQVDFALDQAAQNGWGAWHGAARAGIGNFQGIGTGAKALGQSSSANTAGANSTGRPSGIPDWVPQSMWNMYSNNPYSGVTQSQSTTQNTTAPIPSLANGRSYSGPYQTMPFTPGNTPSYQNMPFYPNATNDAWQNMIPMSYGNYGSTPAPPATPNLMSRMSNPGSLYG